MDYVFFVESQIIDPLGRVIAALDDEIEGHVTAEIDLDETSRLRQGYYSILRDRRPDTYGDLATRC